MKSKVLGSKELWEYVKPEIRDDTINDPNYLEVNNNRKSSSLLEFYFSLFFASRHEFLNLWVIVFIDPQA